MKIVGVDHIQITIPVGTEAEGRAFYCEVLGLPEIPKPPALVANGGFWLQVGDRQVHVGVENDVDRTRTKAHLAYQVDDLAAWQKKLVTAGLAIKDQQPIDGRNRFEFRDPFGNRIEFLQYLD